MSNLNESRPLSPHLGIYRWQISNTLSILHRLTGVGLSLGLIPLALWLYGAAYSPDLFQWLSGAAASIPGLVFLLGWTWAFYYHLGNGIRHLNWDIGRGFTIPEMTASGWVVVVFSLALTVLTWAYVVHNLPGLIHA